MVRQYPPQESIRTSGPGIAAHPPGLLHDALCVPPRTPWGILPIWIYPRPFPVTEAITKSLQRAAKCLNVGVPGSEGRVRPRWLCSFRRDGQAVTSVFPDQTSPKWVLLKALAFLSSGSIISLVMGASPTSGNVTDSRREPLPWADRSDGGAQALHSLRQGGGSPGHGVVSKKSDWSETSPGRHTRCTGSRCASHPLRGTTASDLPRAGRAPWQAKKLTEIDTTVRGCARCMRRCKPKNWRKLP